MNLQVPEAAFAPVADPEQTHISIDRVTRTYRKGKLFVPVLDNYSLRIPRGQMLALVGSSGCGKTTLLNLIGGVDRPDSGDIVVGGARISALSDRALADWRGQNVGFIFQFYNLLPTLSARQNVELPLLLNRLSRAERRSRVDRALALVGLEDWAGHVPEELSGGQQQRVAIARALVANADLLLCDEPTGDLDQESARRVMSLLRVLNQDFGRTIVIVTHDPAVAECCDRTVRLARPERER